MTAVAPLVRSCSRPLAPKGPSTHAPTPIIGAVRRYGRDHALDLPEQGRHLGRVVGVTLGQHVRRDLTSVGIDGEMKLAPLPPRTAALLGIPLALPGQLQARAVQH